MHLLLALILVVFSYSAAAKERIPVVIFGEDSNPPYSYLNAAAEPSGIYVDLLHPLFEQMEDYDVQIELVPYERALAALEAGEVLAIFPPYDQPAILRPFIGHYSPPLYAEQVIAFCRADLFDAPPEHWPEDFYGLTLGIITGYLSVGNTLSLAVAQRKIQLSEAETGWHSLMMLMDERIDCYLDDRLAISRYTDQMRAVWQGEPATEVMVIANQYGHLAFGLESHAQFPFRAHFIAQFERIFAQYQAENHLQAVEP